MMQDIENKAWRVSGRLRAVKMPTAQTRRRSHRYFQGEGVAPPDRVTSCLLQQEPSQDLDTHLAAGNSQASEIGCASF